MNAMRLAGAAQLLGADLIGRDGAIGGISTDSRGLSSGDLFVAIRGERFDGHDFVLMARDRDACGVMVDHRMAVDLTQIVVPDTRVALGRFAALWLEHVRSCRREPLRLAALTGSNGKTTVKEMLAAILRNCGEVLATRGNLNNEIGLPLTLLRLLERHDYAVVEMGANHPGEIAYLAGLACPDVALVTNVGPAHLAGFGDLNGVARAKGEIYQGLRPGGAAVINRDEPYASYWKTLVGSGRIIEFGLDQNAEVSGRVLDSSRNRFRLRIDDREIDIDLPLPGLHNVRNALGAAAAGFALGATPETIRAGLERVSPVSGRLQQLSGRDGSTVVNDTYNANPASLQAAMNVVGAWQGTRWLVLGDMGELGSDTATLHAQAGIQARQAGFERLFALGEHSREAATAFGANGLHFAGMDELLESVTGTLAIAGDAPIILVKGSRSMRMERAVAALTTGPDRNSASGERS